MAAVLPASVSLRWPRWRPLSLIVGAALALRLWGLSQNGWGSPYYTAAVRSMGESWHNFFYLSFDPAGFASLDKPPVAVWLQVISTQLFGFSPLAVMLPQVLCGVVAVVVLYQVTRARLGEGVGLLAALFLAVTPAWVAVNRTNNVDSCLLLVLLLAGWAMLHAVETGRRRALFGAMALIGLAFNVKMLAAYVVLPVFFAAYFVFAPIAWKRRLQDLLLGALVVFACSAPWALAYQLTPADQRPWIGSTPNNTMWELVAGHNGLGRFSGKANASQQAPDVTAADAAVPVLSRLFVRAQPGPARLAQGLFPVQFAWFLPLALAGIALLVKDRRNTTLVFWTGWAAIYAVVYSALGGVMHLYYVNTLAPALAVLAAAAFFRLREEQPIALAALLCATLAWQVAIHEGALAKGTDIDASLWVQCGAGAITVLAALALALRRIASQATLAATAALCALPLLWDASLLLKPTPGLTPSADLYRLSPKLSEVEQRSLAAFGRMPQTARLQQYLFDRRGDAHYLVASTTTQVVAPIIIRTRENAIAMGGIHGMDPAMPPERLAQLVGDGDVRFVLLGDATAISRRMGANGAQRPVIEWVRANGKPVPPELWRDPGAGNARLQLYDMSAR